MDWNKANFNQVEIAKFSGMDTVMIGLNALRDKVGKDKNLEVYVEEAINKASLSGLPTDLNILDYAEYTDDVTHERIGYRIEEVNGEDLDTIRVIDFN